VTTPAEIAARHTALDVESFTHVQRLLGTWGILADLSFSDLLVLAEVRGSGGSHMVVLGQVRPSTAATVLRADLVGQMIAVEDWPLAGESLASGELLSAIASLPVHVPGSALATEGGGDLVADLSETGEIPAVPPEASIECVPVRSGGDLVAVMVRVGAIGQTRRPGRLERVYRDLYQRLASMVASGTFPFPGEELATEDAPRVGDGLMVVDSEGRLTFASPNAVNALHRSGVNTALEGHRLAELGAESSAVDHALATGRPVIEEVERRSDAIMLLHCTPLIEDSSVTGAMVLVRDVTDLRRLDRLLLSKDAAIREVHHRVKNNLQTISALLRLQARRLDSVEGRLALREAERRVRSIAVVHEILSREPGDQVPFQQIVELLLRMAEDSVPPGVEVVFRMVGDAGEVSADIATPLSVVLAELLQNAVEHAFAIGIGTENEPPLAGSVELSMHNDGVRLSVSICDDGRGLPEGFDIDQTDSLGLSIVRDLVTSQLYGTITMRSGRIPAAPPEEPRGVSADLERSGTCVEIDIPVSMEDLG
jgi:two-component sensor histidine kinase